MSQGRFVGFAIAVGIAVPVTWLVVYWLFLRGNAAIMSEGHIRALSVIWPSWPLLMADPEERSVAIPAMSVAINALLYGIVGWLIWFGLNRNRLVLAVVAVALVVGWLLLQRWLSGGQ
jgi:hypothetical protein